MRTTPATITDVFTSALVIALIVVTCRPAYASGPALVILREGKPEQQLARRIEDDIRTRRSVLPLRSLPAVTRSPEEIANQQRLDAIAHALARARKHEEIAAWDACAKEAGDKLGVATEVLATANELGLLRDLHIQIGACMSMGPEPSNAQPHFRTATLLDESPPQKGLHREEAELAHEEARSEVLSRLRGPVRIETEPAGAEVWIDGKKASGVTPLDVAVRLGSHFVTVRRFRYEPQTRSALLQPKSSLSLTLESARRDTLGRQLAEVNAGRRKLPKDELRLARALWSKASQIVLLSPANGPARRGGVRMTLLDANQGATVRSRSVASDIEDDALLEQVCGLLGERCVAEESSVFESPWFWIATGAALIGGGIAIGFVVDSQRDTVFCPAGGC